MSEYQGKTWFSSHLTDSTGGYSMATTATSTATKTFTLGPPPAGETWAVHRILPFLQDGVNQRAEQYGALGAALTNGILLRVVGSTGNVVTDLLDGAPIKSNGDWANHCFDAELKEWGAGDEILSVRWTFAKAGIPLQLTSTEQLDCVIQDNLSALTEQTIIAQGYKDK